ncbi:hypothetical protein Pla22_14040 [Rubripirellula amarantea]|uniref:Uncharacterized protein n=1 Tax=Rubripirellula amarantea TaxID=2527999 RepID=A0A5C5WUK4_9BACT|nr:hypothetical protein [Rubripirellula amarantea]TWT53771.1 hypothetical protein Pla22_14040 [Rubripirellula amarantea]
MRVVVLILVLVLVLGLIGWLQFSSPNGNPTIEVDTDKVRQDTSTIVEKTKNAVDSAAGKIDASIDREPVAPVDPVAP